MNENYSSIIDLYSEKIVVIQDIQFKGKRKINWNCVEVFLKKYIGENYKILETQDVIEIGKDFPDEYCGSNDTARLRGTLAKAKANAVQAIPELIQAAVNKKYKTNLAEKHSSDAMHGWYRYQTRFALPTYQEGQKTERYNIFCAELLVRHANDGRMYLYDMVNIKKETSTPLKQSPYGYKPISFS